MPDEARESSLGQPSPAEVGTSDQVLIARRSRARQCKTDEAPEAKATTRTKTAGRQQQQSRRFVARQLSKGTRARKCKTRSASAQVHSRPTYLECGQSQQETRNHGEGEAAAADAEGWRPRAPARTGRSRAVEKRIPRGEARQTSKDVQMGADEGAASA